jgi:phospholipase/lecithinase/hemolysin
MNPIFSRTLKALCSVMVAAMLSACGASSTVDPFQPTRVVGLGDGYNDITATVREGSTTDTVVQQMAAYFGQSNVVSYAGNGKKIADLASQITTATNAHAFSAGDMVVITVGTHDVIDGTNLTTAKSDLVAAVQSLLDAGVKHVLIMPVLEVSLTPWGLTGNPSFSTTATNTFNDAILAVLSTTFGGQSANKVIYANASGLTVAFRNATSIALAYSPFTDTGFGGTNPACGSGSVANTAWLGCDAPSNANSTNANYTTMLFADGIHLTPAGNRWAAGFLYNATAQGWR